MLQTHAHHDWEYLFGHFCNSTRDNWQKSELQVNIYLNDQQSSMRIDLAYSHCQPQRRQVKINFEICHLSIKYGFVLVALRSSIANANVCTSHKHNVSINVICSVVCNKLLNGALEILDFVIVQSAQ